MAASGRCVIVELQVLCLVCFRPSDQKKGSSTKEETSLGYQVSVVIPRALDTTGVTFKS